MNLPLELSIWRICSENDLNWWNWKKRFSSLLHVDPAEGGCWRGCCWDWRTSWWPLQRPTDLKDPRMSGSFASLCHLFEFAAGSADFFFALSLLVKGGWLALTPPWKPGESCPRSLPPGWSRHTPITREPENGELRLHASLRINFLKVCLLLVFGIGLATNSNFILFTKSVYVLLF